MEAGPIKRSVTTAIEAQMSGRTRSGSGLAGHGITIVRR